MSTFPSILSTYTDPLATNKLNAPSHSGIEQAQNSGLKQVEAVIGVEGNSSVVGTLEYFIKSPASDGGGHVQAANKGGTGLTSYTKGDLLVASSSSVLSKLAIGTNAFVLTADSTQGSGTKWAAAPAAPTGLSIAPFPMVAMNYAGGNTNTTPTSIQGILSSFVLPFGMTINRLGILGNGSSGTSVSAAFYSESGTQEASITGFGFGSNLGAANYPIPVSSVALTAGVHYLAVTAVSGSHIFLTSSENAVAGTSANAASGKRTYAGSILIAGGVLPASITTTNITPLNNAHLSFRLDT